MEITQKIYAEWSAKLESKEKYLAWKAEQRKRYAEITLQIRELKTFRKPYKYQYRTEGNTSQKRTRIGDNILHVNWTWQNQSKFWTLRAEAKKNMEERLIAKEVSKLMRTERLKKAA